MAAQLAAQPAANYGIDAAISLSIFCVALQHADRTGALQPIVLSRRVDCLREATWRNVEIGESHHVLQELQIRGVESRRKLPAASDFRCSLKIFMIASCACGVGVSEILGLSANTMMLALRSLISAAMVAPPGIRSLMDFRGHSSKAQQRSSKLASDSSWTCQRRR